MVWSHLAHLHHFTGRYEFVVLYDLISGDLAQFVKLCHRLTVSIVIIQFQWHHINRLHQFLAQPPWNSGGPTGYSRYY